MTLHQRHDVLSVSWNKYPLIVFHQCHHVLLRYRWQILCLFPFWSESPLCHQGSPWPCWEEQGRRKQSAECFPGYAAQKLLYFTPDWKGREEAGTSSAPLPAGHELCPWQISGFFSAPGAPEMGSCPQPGCHVRSGLVLPGELICATCFNLKGSHNTEGTPLFGIRLVFIHSALVLTGAE